MVKRMVKVISGYFLYYTGILPSLLKKYKSRPKIFVFMYHKLNNEKGGGLEFSIFRKQIMFLKKYFDIMPLEKAVKIIKDKALFKRNIAVITFDDGYMSFFELAYNFLSENNVPATVFITTDCADGKDIIWTEKVKSPALKEQLKALPDKRKEAILAELSDASDTNSRMLTWPVIKKMENGLISFGAHTVSHPILSKVSLERAKKEIADSKNRIERNIGEPVSAFCYPNGKENDFNDSVIDIIKKNDFEYACSAIEGVNTEESDIYALKRLSTSERHLPLFAGKLFFKYILR